MCSHWLQRLRIGLGWAWLDKYLPWAFPDVALLALAGCNLQGSLGQVCFYSVWLL